MVELLAVATVVPAVNQIEIHPRLPQTALVDYCQAQGVAVTAYSPLARGGGLFDHPAVASVAAKHGVSPAQAVLRWNVERGVVAGPHTVYRHTAPPHHHSRPGPHTSPPLLSTSSPLSSTFYLIRSRFLVTALSLKPHPPHSTNSAHVDAGKLTPCYGPGWG